MHNKGLNSLGGSKFRSKFEAASGYWQLPIMVPGASEMAAFVTKRGLYEPVVMPFGLKNVPATFQQMIDSMVLNVKGKWEWVHIEVPHKLKSAEATLHQISICPIRISR